MLEPKPTAEVKAAWSREVARRLAEVDGGTAEIVEWEDVRAELFGD
ncbi:MAG TPA: addiction module protein [Thermoanaerobaculia bacterium]